MKCLEKNMVTAAKTISQVIAHTAIAFTLTYWLTGSVVFGGMAAILEPIINVALLPLHQRFWLRIRTEISQSVSKASLMLSEKISQLGMHMGIAFAVIFWATGSVAFGGLAAILEPVCNVVLLPFHDRAWEKFRMKIRTHVQHPFHAA
jgi:uncharacterized membrane protein